MFWTGVVILGAIWCLLPIRRDQATLLLRGWYPGWMRLVQDSSPEARERARGLDQHLLTRFWLTNDGVAPRALSGGFAWTGQKGQDHFCAVIVPQLTTRAKRRAAVHRDLPPWEAVFQADPHAANSGSFSGVHIEGVELTVSVAEGGGMAFERTGPHGALLMVFRRPPAPSRIGDGLAFDLELETDGTKSAPWRLLWATRDHPGFDETRNLLIAPRRNPGKKLVRLVGDFRSIPEWIADEPVLALRLELPLGESPRGGLLRYVYAARFSDGRSGTQATADSIHSVTSQELHDL